MSCRYCGYETSHHSSCPAYDPRAPKPAPVKNEGSRDVRYSGGEFEYDLFGKADIQNPEYRKELDRLRKPDGYFTYKDAVDLAKKFQTWDPANPDKEFLRELVVALQDKLNIDIEKNPDAVGAYSALKTPLDVLHGVDAFLTVKRDGKEEIVTLDATLNKDKQRQGHKADFVIGDEFPDVAEDEDGYLQAIDSLAGKIALRFEGAGDMAAE
jgi:hypothetical protein